MSNGLLDAIHDLVMALDHAEIILSRSDGRAAVRKQLASRGHWHATQVLSDLEVIFEVASVIDMATLEQGETAQKEGGQQK